jgi:cellulose synthase operon protein YhjQ
MRVIAITSGNGGSGRSTVCANLACVLARRGKRVLVVDFDPQNTQRLLLGLDLSLDDGLAREGIHLESVFDSPFGNNDSDGDPDGLHFIPFGRLRDDELDEFVDELVADPHWLDSRIGGLSIPDTDIVIIDTPRMPSPFAQQALRSCDLALSIVSPDAASIARLHGNESTVDQMINQARFKGHWQIVNRMPVNNRLAHATRQTLLAQTSPQPTPITIHQDPAVAQAFAHARPVTELFPGTMASLDFQYLADWLLDTLRDD